MSRHDACASVFDNNEDFTKRGTMLGGSRIVLMQPHTDSVSIRFPTDHSDLFYTDVRGKHQHLSNGNLLLTEAQAGHVAEVDPEGRTVWAWVHTPYSSSKVPVVIKAPRLNLTRSQIADWPCASVDSTGAP